MDPIKPKVYRRFYEPAVLLSVLRSLKPPMPQSQARTPVTAERRFVDAVVAVLGPGSAAALGEGRTLLIAGAGAECKGLSDALAAMDYGQTAVPETLLSVQGERVAEWRRMVAGCLAQAGGSTLPALQRIIRVGTDAAAASACAACLRSRDWQKLRQTTRGLKAGVSGNLYDELEENMRNLANYTVMQAPLTVSDSNGDRIMGRVFRGEQEIASYRIKLYELDQMYTSNSEPIPARLARACSTKTHVHSEMQILQHFRSQRLDFYDADDPYIASGSGACYLCMMYVAALRPRERFELRGTGEEICLDWAPPNPGADERILMTMLERVRDEAIKLLDHLYGNGPTKKPRWMQTDAGPGPVRSEYYETGRRPFI
ncbi:hypothetical protein EDC01DRAFT_492109 [Geopyxis carbonaria]|nr:hypothetical protein EDC01DRAFT_492109 [Geopyxis carbonaria]